MKPTHTRLTCRAHNRFSPSIALWQYFVGPDRPFLSQQRHSSNVPRAVQTGASKDNDQLQSPASADLPRSDAQVEKDSGTPDSGKVVKPQLKIRRKRTGKGIWHENKVDASIAKNIKTHHVIRQATMDALLAEARVAFKASEDYIGRAVEPKMHPTYVKESQLPWTLSASKSTMQGIDRLAIEIDRFYEYTQPNHYEQIARKHLIEQVQRNVLKTLPNHVLETFGSERTGLALPTSDIDLRLTTKERMEDPAMSRLPPSSTERLALRRTLTKLYWQEMRLNTTYTSVEFRQARYPLISLQDEQSGLDVQIVLNNDTSLSREFTNKYLEEYPYLRQLYFVIKTIFDMRGLTDVFTGGIGSYSLFMMIVASIRGLPHKRHDAAGGLLNFLRFYSNFDCTKNGIQIEPWWIFDKAQHSVLTDKVVKQLKKGTIKPLPPYMLSLRDPADETNDLGHKAIAIKHFQATVAALDRSLSRDLQINTRDSLLGPLVSPSYMLYKERRHKLSEYGKRLSNETKTKLAVNARLLREGAECDKTMEELQEYICRVKGRKVKSGSAI